MYMKVEPKSIYLWKTEKEKHTHTQVPTDTRQKTGSQGGKYIIENCMLYLGIHRIKDMFKNLSAIFYPSKYHIHLYTEEGRSPFFFFFEMLKTEIRFYFYVNVQYFIYLLT